MGGRHEGMCLGLARIAPCNGRGGDTLRAIVPAHERTTSKRLVHDHRKWNRVARSILRIGELCAVTFGDRVISVSQCLAADLKRRFPWAAAKIYFIPNGATHFDPVGSEMRRGDDVFARYGLDKNKY